MTTGGEVTGEVPATTDPPPDDGGGLVALTRVPRDAPGPRCSIAAHGVRTARDDRRAVRRPRRARRGDPLDRGHHRRVPRPRLHRRAVARDDGRSSPWSSGRPLLLEGEAGVGKTELAKVLAATLGARLIRLQCYEGLDVNTAVYEWNYPRQMLEIRLLEARGEIDKASAHDIFGPEFLLKRPLLQALEATDGSAPVLLIDEIDRADEEFEAYLLEILSDFQVTVPEIGTIRAAQAPRVVLTSNRTREVHDALKRRCLYHWIDYPTASKEFEIVGDPRPRRAAAARPRGRRLRPPAARPRT